MQEKPLWELAFARFDVYASYLDRKRNDRGDRESCNRKNLADVVKCINDLSAGYLCQKDVLCTSQSNLPCNKLLKPLNAPTRIDSPTQNGPPDSMDPDAEMKAYAGLL